MSYVDGFLIPVPNDRNEDYIAAAAVMAPLFKEWGALSVMETWGDNLADGKVTDFKRAVKAEPGENVVFSWVVWPDKATRDAAGVKMMEDPRLENMPMPFDGKRLIFGGFTPILEA
ncbi:DUF1428 domain-containing protein [soil metagenome]